MLIASCKHGVYGSTLIIKQWLQHTHVLGDVIDAHFAEKNVGDMDAMKKKMMGFCATIWGLMNQIIL